MSKSTKSQDISKALHPTFPIIEVPRKYFLAPAPQTEATQGVLERQRQAVYNLETAPPEAISYLVNQGAMTAKKPVNLESIDLETWGAMDRWWAINEILESGGTVLLYNSKEAAQAALAESEGINESHR